MKTPKISSAGNKKLTLRLDTKINVGIWMKTCFV